MPWTTCSLTEMQMFLGKPYRPLKAQMPPRRTVSRSAMASNSSRVTPGATARVSSSSTSKTISEASRMYAISSRVLISIPPGIYRSACPMRFSTSSTVPTPSTGRTTPRVL